MRRAGNRPTPARGGHAVSESRLGWRSRVALIAAASLALGGCVVLKEPGAQEVAVPANPTLAVIGSKGPLSQR